MDALAYRISQDDAATCTEQFPLTKTSAANFSNEVRPVITSHGKTVCMTAKQPNHIRIIANKGKYTDTTLTAPVIRQLVSTESFTDHPMLFYAVGGKSLTILNPKRSASGELGVSLAENTYDEELYASTPGEAGFLYVLGEKNVLKVNEATGAVKNRMTLTPKTTVRFPTIDFHRKSQLLLVPAKSANLDLLSTRTDKSVLSKPWEPHADAVPTAAHFFQVHNFDDEKGEEVLLMTAARGNSEIRLWSYSSATQRFSLRQEITLTNTESGEEFDLSITPSEEYLVLASRSRSLTVVIETHRHQLKAHRITTWKTMGPSMCCVAYVGKVSESQLSKSVRFEVIVTIRNSEGYTEAHLDLNKLVGASNTVNLKPSSVKNWFPGVAEAADNSASLGSTQLTAVSSSLRGDSKTTSAISELSAAKVVRQQAQRFCEQVHSLEDEFMAVQKRTSMTMRMLQDSKYREEAQASGRNFAIRNKSRLEGTCKASSTEKPEHGMMSESQRELIMGISNFMKSIEGNSERAAAAALKSLLAKHLKTSVQKAMSDMEQLEVTGSTATNLNSAESTRKFRNDIDGSHKQLLARVRDFHAQLRTSLETSTQDCNAAVDHARAFADKVRRATADLRRDLTETAKVVRAKTTSSIPVDPETLVARAVAEAEDGNWPTAVTTALESSDITVLLPFLCSTVCEKNAQTLMSPKTLPLPLFLSLCLQLSFELDLYPAEVPLRVRHLQQFVVDWDDALRGIKTQAAKDAHQAITFDLVKSELGTVLASLNKVDIKAMERKTRNSLRLLTKLLVSLVSE